MAQLSSSKGLDRPGLLISFKTLSLRPKDSFVHPSPLKKKNLFWRVTGSEILPRKQSLLPALTSGLQPYPDYWRQAFVLSQSGRLPAKNRVETAMQGH